MIPVEAPGAESTIGMPSLEMAIEKRAQAVIYVGRSRAVVFQPVPEQREARLEVRVIERMVRAGISHQLDGRTVVKMAGTGPAIPIPSQGLSPTALGESN